MKSGSSIVLAAVCVMSFISLCGALNCYVCTSKNHSACLDPFDKERAYMAGFNQTCPEPEDPKHQVLCRKSHQTVLGKLRIIRGCGYVNSSRQCQTTRNSEVIFDSCQCFNDLCNTATAPGLPVWLLAVPALLAAGLTRRH